MYGWNVCLAWFMENVCKANIETCFSNKKKAMDLLSSTNVNQVWLDNRAIGFDTNSYWKIDFRLLPQMRQSSLQIRRQSRQNVASIGFYRGQNWNVCTWLIWPQSITWMICGVHHQFQFGTECVPFIMAN